MTSQVTIRAKVNEKIGDDGIGYAESVRITGAGFLNASAIQDIAQEAVDSYHGTDNNQTPRLGWAEWREAENKDDFTVRVVNY